MRICIIGSSPPKSSGLAFYTQDLLAELKKLVKVDLISWNYSSRIAMLFAPLFRIGELWRALRSYDVVHVQYVLGEFMFLFLPLLCLLSIGRKATLVATTHEDYRNLPLSSLFILFHNIFYSCFDIIMVHTEEHKSVLSKRIQKRAVVIPFGTKPDFAHAKINSRTVLLPGFINPWKGHDIAVKAMASVIKKVPDAKLLIVGKPYDKAFAEKIRAMSASAPVELHDEFVPYGKYRAFFSSSEIIILPYRRITMSAVLSDVVGMAKPCICSELPAFREYTKGRALFFKPGDHEALAGQIILLLENRKLQETMISELRALAKEYDWKNVARSTLRLYKK